MELKTGDLVELLVDANFIPAGKYHFKKEGDDTIILQVAGDIEIGLSTNYWKPFLRQISDFHTAPTTVEEFLDGYFCGLGRVSSFDTPNCFDRHTYCTIDPRHLFNIEKRLPQKAIPIKNFCVS